MALEAGARSRLVTANGFACRQNAEKRVKMNRLTRKGAYFYRYIN